MGVEKGARYARRGIGLGGSTGGVDVKLCSERVWAKKPVHFETYAKTCAQPKTCTRACSILASM